MTRALRIVLGLNEAQPGNLLQAIPAGQYTIYTVPQASPDSMAALQQLNALLPDDKFPANVKFTRKDLGYGPVFVAYRGDQFIAACAPSKGVPWLQDDKTRLQDEQAEAELYTYIEGMSPAAVGQLQQGLDANNPLTADEEAHIEDTKDLSQEEAAVYKRVKAVFVKEHGAQRWEQNKARFIQSIKTDPDVRRKFNLPAVEQPPPEPQEPEEPWGRADDWWKQESLVRRVLGQ